MDGNFQGHSVQQLEPLFVKIRPLMDGNYIISISFNDFLVKIRPLMDGNIQLVLMI